MNDKASPFWCDLVEKSFLHRHFLETIHELGVSLAPLPYESLRRYRDLWLPLVHRNPSTELIPPPDIAWIWHCHRLSPRDYVRYVTKTFGDDCILEACPPFAVQVAAPDDDQESFASHPLVTRRLWHEAYRDEPFFLSSSSTTITFHEDKERLIGGFDLLGATKSQATFLWQICGERFGDKDFLEEGRENYLKFLKLGRNKDKHGSMLVPTTQIDLLWHTHILSSMVKYNEDCEAILGATFHHDYSDTDRSTGCLLEVGFLGTKQLWLDEYGEDYAVPGGMHLGEPPEFFFQQTFVANKQLLDVAQIARFAREPASEPWASLNGKASDGSPAFLEVGATLRMDSKELPRRDYVLGKGISGTGFYHLETREANELLSKRAAVRREKLEASIWMEQRFYGSPKSVARQEKKLVEAKALCAILETKLAAKGPPDIRAHSPADEMTGKSMSSVPLDSDSVVFLYPVDTWNGIGGNASDCGNCACARDCSGGGGGGGGGGCGQCGNGCNN